MSTGKMNNFRQLWSGGDEKLAIIETSRGVTAKSANHNLARKAIVNKLKHQRRQLYK
jgi:hypothetical protein